MPRDLTPGRWLSMLRAVAHARAVHHRCRRLLAELRLPTDFSADDLVAEVVKHRGGRRILVRAIDLDGGAPCGMYVATTDFDIVLFPRNTTSLHQLHIITHELAHILFEHSGLVTSVSAAEYSHAVLRPIDLLSARASGVSPKLIRRLLGRSVYDDAREHEAELFATMALVQRSSPSAESSPLHLLRRRLSFAG